MKGATPMIANNVPKNQLAGVETLEELANEEMGRFKKALNKASSAYFDKQSVGLSPKEAKNLWLKVSRAGTLISVIADDAQDTAFTLLKDPNHQRKPWDAYMTGARTLTRTTPTGFALGVAAKVLGLEDTVNKIASLISRSTEVQGDLYQVAAKTKKFIDHYEWAKKQAEKYGSTDDGLIRKYANLKTWEKKDEFQQFSSVAEKATDGIIEVFVEGPVKLYLMISSGQLMVVIQGLIARDSFEFQSADEKGLGNSLSLLLNAQKAVEISPLFKIVRELFAQGLKEYHASWKEEHLEIRQSALDEDREKRFIQCFENGTLFVK